MSSGIASFKFDNSYQRLPGQFHAHVLPTPVAAPRLIALNEGLCAELGLSATALLTDAAGVFSGNILPEGSASIAQVYAAHQFGNFVPQLGDGRAQDADFGVHVFRHPAHRGDDGAHALNVRFSRPFDAG